MIFTHDIAEKLSNLYVLPHLYVCLRSGNSYETLM